MAHSLNHQWPAPLPPKKCFFWLFLTKTKQEIKRSQVMFMMVNFSPTALSFGYDFGTPCIISPMIWKRPLSALSQQYMTLLIKNESFDLCRQTQTQRPVWLALVGFGISAVVMPMSCLWQRLPQSLAWSLQSSLSSIIIIITWPQPGGDQKP